MKRAVLLVAALVCVLGHPARVYAQSDFIDWLESFSGPGPFSSYMRSVGVRGFCTFDEGKGNGHRVDTCLNDTDPKIRTVLTAEYAWASSGDDHPRFATVDPNNKTPVNTSRITVNYYYRFSPMLDVGVGAGTFVFTGNGFDNQWHALVTPLTLTFTPLGFLHGETSAKWGRVLRVKFDEKYVMGDINSLDFRSPGGYLKSGELNRGLSLAIDFWSFISRAH